MRIHRLLTAAALCGCALAARPAVIEQIMVRVNNQVITRAEFDKRKAQTLAAMKTSLPAEEYAEALKTADTEVLRRMTEEALLIEKARQSYDLEKLIDFQVDNFMQNNGIKSKGELEAKLKSEGLTMAAFREQVLRFAIPDFIRSREIRGTVAVPRAEVEAYYKRHEDEFTGSGRRRAAQIVFDPARHPDAAEQRAAIEAALKAGKPFPEVAHAHSDAPGGAQGGDLGLVAKGELRRELDGPLFAAEKAGTILGPIEAGDKTYWLYLAKIEPVGLAPLEEAAPEIERKLAEERYPAAAEKFMADLWNRNYVVIAPEWRAILPKGVKPASSK